MVDTALYLLGLFLLALFCLIALASLVVGLPGTFLIVIAAWVYAWATGFLAVTWTTLGWLLGLAVLAEGLEFASAAVASGSESPSRRVAVSAIVGGIVGGIVGTPFFFGVGSLLGALAGAFAGATVAASAEGRDTASAMRTGMSAMRGRLLGFIVKAAIGALMLVVLFGAAI